MHMIQTFRAGPDNGSRANSSHPRRAAGQNRGAVEEIETRRFQDCGRLNSWASELSAAQLDGRLIVPPLTGAAKTRNMSTG